MEQFLESVDMSNLRTMLENDSDYCDEVDMVAGTDKASQSATSHQYSQSVKSNMKSPMTKQQSYKRPTFQMQQPKLIPGGNSNR